MEDFKIVSSMNNVQAQETINGSVVNYVYSISENKEVGAISFFLNKKDGGEIKGTVYQGGKVDVQSSSLKAEDIDIIKLLMNRCDSIRNA